MRNFESQIFSFEKNDGGLTVRVQIMRLTEENVAKHLRCLRKIDWADEALAGELFRNVAEFSR